MFDLNSIFEQFQQIGIDVGASEKQKIQEQIEQVLSYEPKVGFFGKTGAGKSSLGNALFKKDTFQINDIEACTRNPQEEMLKFSNGKGIKLVDMPGVGESSARDDEYSKLYNRFLPDLDLVLWLIKADDRAISVDLNFYENIIKPHIQQNKPFLFVLSQVDKIEPCREWDFDKKEPGSEQLRNIEKKIEFLASKFSCHKSAIIPVSATTGYNLNFLVRQIIDTLPKEKRYTTYREISQEYHDQNTDAVVEKSLLDTIIEVIGNVVKVGKFIIEQVVPFIGTVVSSFFSLFG